MSYFSQINLADSASLDAFQAQRISQKNELFSVQSQYDTEPLQMESGATGTGVVPVHNVNTRMVDLVVEAGIGTSFHQSYQYSPYEPGNSQFIAATGVIGAGVAGASVDLGYFDGNNGIFLRQNGTINLQFVQRTSTSGSISDVETVNQADWNIDRMDGTGPSGITLDITKSQILIIDLQFLGMGRVRVGFDINGLVYYSHNFLNANNLTVPYMQNATLPIQMLVSATSTIVPKTCSFKCATVQSEGGEVALAGYTFTTPQMIVTAGADARTLLTSIRPKTTFKGISNRSMFEILKLNLIATGADPVFWELVVGGNYAGKTFSDVNADYSSYEYSVAGTYTNLTGGIVIASDYIGGAGSGGASRPQVNVIDIPSLISRKYPIALNRAGAVRSMGTLTLLVSGIGVASSCRGSITYKEIR